MSTHARYVLGAVFAALTIAMAAVAVRGQPQTAVVRVIGHSWPIVVGSDSALTTVREISANDRDELTVTLLDGRTARVTSSGATVVAEMDDVKFKVQKAGFSGRDSQWLVSSQQARLLNAAGRETHSVKVPRGAKNSLALSDGNLAFLTPRGRTLISIVDPDGRTVSAFGEPVDDYSVTEQQRAWLNEGTLLETSGRGIVIAFTHLPYPMVRYYSRTGKLVSETTLRSPGIDKVAAAAVDSMADVPSTCSGGLLTAYGIAYDRQSDSIWVTSAADDGIGYVRVIDRHGTSIGQAQFMVGTGGEPMVPASIEFGGRYLYWLSGSQIYRADASAIRRAIRPGLVGQLVSRFVENVYAQTACGTPQTLDSSCPYNCPTGTVTCTVNQIAGGFNVESQSCLSPPTTPVNFKGCEKSVTFCNPSNLQRDTRTHRIECPKRDADTDQWSPDDEPPDFDCDDNDAGINPGISPTCDSGLGQDFNCDGIDDLSQCNSPIIVDVSGDGFKLSNSANGVTFDLNRDGSPERLPWTLAGSDDAWLALDRNRNGVIDSGEELFGNFTPQPPGPDLNGFLALAVFDAANQGGNRNAWIDAGDAIYSQLRLWTDRNHDGMSQPDELSTLAAMGLKRISLDYRESQRTDRWGNWFRYRAKVRDANDRDIGQWAYDVFLAGRPVERMADR